VRTCQFLHKTGVILGGTTAVAAAAGASDGAGQVKCWGSNDAGQLVRTNNSPFLHASVALQMSCSHLKTCTSARMQHQEIVHWQLSSLYLRRACIKLALTIVLLMCTVYACVNATCGELLCCLDSLYVCSHPPHVLYEYNRA
jgi:hypothetical protein